MNRLTAGNSIIGNSENSITYDLNGNISTLNRYQAQANNNNPIDQLSYTYNNTNQLQNVTDNSGYFGTTDLVSGTTNYTYDNNGNVLSSSNITNAVQNKGYTYNMLNLPSAITTATGTVTYTYDANSRKLRKVSIINGTTKTTDYIDGIEYDNSNNSIAFIQTEEGKAVPYNPGDNIWRYDYNYYLSDNLGNTRVTFDTKNGVVSPLQTDDYYPFGLEINSLVNSTKNEYLYNKKELQEELGQYDYGARFYDPVIGRWTTPDPLAEKLVGWSPYNYVLNNPMKLFDPDGLFPFPVTVRAFAPPGSFKGSGFDDDKRGFSASSNASSRLSQTTTIDPATGEVSGGHVTSTGTHFFGIPVGNAENFSSEGSVDRVSMSGNGDDHTLSVDEHLTGSDPAGLKLAPDVMLNSGISLTENDKAGYLDANITLTGKGFPASEALIGDTGGKNILLTGAATYGGLTDLIKNDPKQVASIGVRISIDGKGNFTGVTYNGKTYSVADWNKAQQAAPAGPHHNYSKQNIQGQTEQ